MTALFVITKVDYNITQKSFNFPKKHGLPFYFVSASDGTNVVKVSKGEIWLSLSFILLHCFKMQVLVVEVVVGGVGLGMRLGKGVCF